MDGNRESIGSSDSAGGDGADIPTREDSELPDEEVQYKPKSLNKQYEEALDNLHHMQMLARLSLADYCRACLTAKQIGQHLFGLQELMRQKPKRRSRRTG